MNAAEMLRDLSIGGFTGYHSACDTWKTEPLREDRIKKCREFIREHCRITNRINRKYSSYLLKHIAEAVLNGVHLGNGEMIYAAVLEGCRIEPNGINAFISLQISPAAYRQYDRNWRGGWY